MLSRSLSVPTSLRSEGMPLAAPRPIPRARME
jgi:hypothetical protein